MRHCLAGRRILIVEDEMLVLMTIETALQDAGVLARAAGNVADALLLIDGNRFDAAIIDVNLSGEQSYPIAEALARRAIPFVFSTGYGDHGERIEFGDRPLLHKPYVRGALLAALERLCAVPPLDAAA